MPARALETEKFGSSILYKIFAGWERKTWTDNRSRNHREALPYQSTSQGIQEEPRRSSFIDLERKHDKAWIAGSFNFYWFN